ncbi:MAG TPA: hypothetical protein VEC16_00580 [Alphaproteobacteria bacterium]|nr:hypothetical protein [Alphaproteobacteria bacterium]
MKKKDRKRIYVKSFALFAIYLILSITIFTAQATAVLNYNISGDFGAEGYARRNNDVISIHTVSDSNVSFITGQGTSRYKEINMTNCQVTGASGSSGSVSCDYMFDPVQIGASVKSIPFTLKQQAGTPGTKNGVIYIDGLAPVANSFTAVKNGTGVLFTYSFTDFLNSNTETICNASGIRSVEINMQGRPVLVYDNSANAQAKNCTVSGSHFQDFSGTYGEYVTYYAKVIDRAGNEYYTDSQQINGDFKAPTIINDFKIMRGSEELTEFSSAGELKVDIHVQIEDSNATSGSVSGDLSELHINPAVNIPYKNISAVCIKDSGNVYNCVFKDILLKPSSEELTIAITAKDSDGNVASLSITKFVTLKNSAGKVLFLGTLKDHCTRDLSTCYASSGVQLLRAEIDTTSSYAKSILNIGVDSQRTFAICRLNSTWECTSVYTVPQDAASFELFIADSNDDYGNKLIAEENIKKTIYVDNIAPTLAGNLTSINSNNNNNCSVAGDELFFTVKISEATSPELKIYANTSAFTTKSFQYGTCMEIQNNEWECKLTIKDFISVPNIVEQKIIIEDLAGNKLSVPYTFRVCKSSSDNPPNVIYAEGLVQKSTPNIDRRTASIMPIKTFIPVSLSVRDGAQVMYISIDKCTSPGSNGLDVMSNGHYFIPAYGKDMTMVLNIGHQDAQLIEGAMTINCSVSARINIGDTVYTRDEKDVFVININTFNQPLGELDQTTQNEINNVKNSLKGLDKSLENYETIVSILETICDISDILVKLDALLQTLKSVVYVICLVIQGYPPTTALAQSLWSGFNQIFSTSDAIIQKYVWPTGENGTAIGYIWKYTCIIYNCRFYTLSGLMEIRSDAKDAIDKIQMNNNNGNPPGTKTSTQEEYYPSENGEPDEDPNWDSNNGLQQKSSTEITEYPGGGSETKTTNYAPDGTVTGSIETTSKEYSSGGSYSTSTERTASGEIQSYNKRYTSADGTSYGESLARNSDGTYTLINSDGSSSIVQLTSESTSGGSSGILGSVFGKKSTPTTNGPVLYNIDESSVGGVSNSINNHYSKWYDPENLQAASQRQNLQSLGQQGALYSDIDRHDWIINPYRSTYYDALCLPATVYNIQKERQIKCMYLSCLQDSQSTGLPVSVCKDLYKVNNCLYIKSAQYELNDNLFAQISKGLVQQSIMYSMGFAVQTVYGSVCAEYIESYGAGELNSKAPYSVGCGLFGVGLKYQEITALLQSPGEVMNNIFKGAGVDDPAKIYDYCQGGQLYAD